MSVNNFSSYSNLGIFTGNQSGTAGKNTAEATR
jgi:hypothetical protein